MFVDFDKVFNSKPQSEMKVPDALIQSLSEQLPPGLKYIADEDGSCRIVSNEREPITIGGFKYKPTDKQLQVLGNEYTNQDVLDYIATKKHTPFLPYQSPDVYMDKFNEFYDVILGTK